MDSRVFFNTILIRYFWFVFLLVLTSVCNFEATLMNDTQKLLILNFPFFKMCTLYHPQIKTTTKRLHHFLHFTAESTKKSRLIKDYWPLPWSCCHFLKFLLRNQKLLPQISLSSKNFLLSQISTIPRSHALMGTTLLSLPPASSILICLKTHLAQLSQ